MQGKTIADRAGATLWGGWVVWWTGQAPSVSSGRQRQGWQSSEGASELGFPGPALWQMQSEAAGRAGEPSGHREEAPPEGPGGYHLLPQTDAHGPACQVMGQHLDGRQAPLAAKRPEGRWLRPTPYFRSRMAFSISAWRRWPASSPRVSPYRSDRHQLFLPVALPQGICYRSGAIASRRCYRNQVVAS